MTPEERAYLRYRLRRAREALGEANLLLDAGHFATAVNRIYYACFYAVSALLLSEGQTSTKPSGVRALFDRHWVKSGRIAKELGRFYRDMFDRRQESDYADLVSYVPQEVADWLAQARTFVGEISKRVEEKLQEDEESDEQQRPQTPDRGGTPDTGDLRSC